MGIGKLSVMIAGSAGGFLKAAEAAIDANSKLEKSIAKTQAAQMKTSQYASDQIFKQNENNYTDKSQSSYKESSTEKANQAAFRGVKIFGKVAAAITAVDIITEAWSGDITQAADKIKELPFGIGSVAKSLESVLGKWTGITAEIERNKVYIEATDRSIKLMADSQKLVRDRIAETTKARKADAEEVALGAMSGTELDKAKIRIKYRDMAQEEIDAASNAQKEIDKNIAELEKTAREMDAVRAKAKEEEQKKLKRSGPFMRPNGLSPSSLPEGGEAMRSKIRNLEKQKLEMQKASKSRLVDLSINQNVLLQRAEQKAAQDQQKIEQDKASVLLSINNEITQQRLKNTGETLAAEIHAIESAASARARGYRITGNEAAALATEQLSRDKITEVMQQAQKEQQQKEKEHADTITRINAEMNIRRLQMNGKTREAEMLQIEESYRERIQAAQKAGDAEMVALLEKSKTLDQEAAFAAGRGQGSASQFKAAYTAFGNVNNKSKMPIEGDPKQTELFKQMLEVLRKGQTARAA